tara:strand:- start:3094 stop:3963 length:870 start_codon:yes stop_codon:yes gene_type:complete
LKKIEHTWAIVTGASSGIGECICHELAKKKVNIILCGRDEETIHEIQENLETTYNIKTDFFVGDLVEKGEPERLAKTMGGRYHVQFLFNNAGAGNYGPFLDYSLKEHMDIIDLNIKALTKLTYLFIGHMQAHGKESYISNISSVAAYLTVPFFGLYTGTKKYVKDLTDTLRYEFKNSNISFTTIYPGPTETKFFHHANQKVNSLGKHFMSSPEKVARLGVKATLQKKKACLIGITSKLGAAYSFLPNSVLIPAAHAVMQAGSSYDDRNKTLESKNDDQLFDNDEGGHLQ